MWPFCTQEIYFNAMPLIINTTILNGMGLTGALEGPPRFIPDVSGEILQLSFEWSRVLWPWTGYLAVIIQVNELGIDSSGPATGTVEFTVVSPPAVLWGERTTTIHCSCAITSGCNTSASATSEAIV